MSYLLSLLLTAVFDVIAASKDCPTGPVYIYPSSRPFQLNKGPYPVGTNCSFDIVVPKTCLLKATIDEGNLYSTAAHFVIDAFNRRLKKGETYFPPSTARYSFTFDPTVTRQFDDKPSFLDAQIEAVLDLARFEEKTTHEFDPREGPLVLNLNDFAKKSTHIFRGTSQFTALYLPYWVTYPSWLPNTLQTVMVFNGSGSRRITEVPLGTVFNLTSPRSFTTLSIYNAQFEPQEYASPEVVLLLGSKDFFEEYSNPRFMQPQSTLTTFSMNTTEGPTYLTVVTHGYLLNEYILREFDPTKDFEFVILDGFASRNASEERVLAHFNSSTADQLGNFSLVLKGTVTVLLLKGNLTFVYDNSLYGNEITHSDFARGLVWKGTDDGQDTEHVRDNMLWATQSLRQWLFKSKSEWFEHTFTWIEWTNTSVLVVFNYSSWDRQLYYPENETSFVTQEPKIFILYGGKSKLEYTIRATNAPELPVEPVYDEAEGILTNRTLSNRDRDCIRFRFFDCLS